MKLIQRNPYHNNKESQTKADIVIQLLEIIEKKHLTITQLVPLFSLSSSQISHILNGRFRNYSIEFLNNCLKKII